MSPCLSVSLLQGSKVLEVNHPKPGLCDQSFANAHLTPDLYGRDFAVPLHQQLSTVEARDERFSQVAWSCTAQRLVSDTKSGSLFVLAFYTEGRRG